MDTATLTRGWPVAVGVAGAVLVDYGANQLGWWWATAVIGVAVGLLMRGVLAFAVALTAPVLAWGGDLLLQSGRADLSRIARITASLAGLGRDNTWAVYLLTVLVGVLLGLCGYWLGAAARRVVLSATAPTNQPSPAVPVAEPESEPVSAGRTVEEGARR